MEAILNLISERLPIALTPPSSSPSVIKSSASDSPLLPVVNEITFEPIIPSLQKNPRQVNFSIGESSSNVTSRNSYSKDKGNTSGPFDGNLGGTFGNCIDQRAVISISVFGETLKTQKLSDYLVFKKNLLSYNASYSQQVRLSRCLDLSLVQDIFASFPDELGEYNYYATS